MNESN